MAGETPPDPSLQSLFFYPEEAGSVAQSIEAPF